MKYEDRDVFFCAHISMAKTQLLDFLKLIQRVLDELVQRAASFLIS